MKVLILNGSPHDNGNTMVALKEMINIFDQEGVETEIVQVGGKEVRGCIGCNTCQTRGKCIFNDMLNEVAEKFEQADGLIVASPVYYASANGTLIALLDRLFFSTAFDKTMKVGACVVAARRGGLSATYDQLHKYFGNSSMPIATSQYWNSIHGMTPGEAAQDIEGLQTMRTLARNMTFLMRSIALGREAYGVPQPEPWTPMHFIH